MHYVVLYPQSGDRIVTIDSVTLLHRMYSAYVALPQVAPPQTKQRIACTFLLFLFPPGFLLTFLLPALHLLQPCGLGVPYPETGPRGVQSSNEFYT